ncbi:MAG: hypothetical protein U0892_13835 [Pirellulales bacterium]
MARFPKPELPDEYSVVLAQMVAKTSWLPHPATVKEFSRAVFPTVRARKGFPRCSTLLKDGVPVGMFDDNATPAWALLWSHNIHGRQKGWTVAHVWDETDCIYCFTNLANLALVPECFASLTDKTGPLTHFLRRHAWQVYGWKPAQVDQPQKPDGYDSIEWNYFQHVANPKQLIAERLKSRSNQRAKVLKELMSDWLSSMQSDGLAT